MKRFALSLIVLAFLLSPCFAADEFTAQWIGPQEPAPANSWLCYRYTFDQADTINSATARIACDSKYWLWINDELVIFEGQLKRGPSPENTYFDPVDLTANLKKGKNTIAILLWYWGKHGFSHNSSGKAGLLVDAKINDTPLLSSSDWKVTIHPSYGKTEPPHPNYRLSEQNVLFDARNDITNWNTSKYDDSSWSNAAEYGTPPTAPWNTLEPRPILQWKNSGLIDYQSVTKTTDDKGNTIVTAKLPYNAHITPYLEVDAPAGKAIDIRTDDYIVTGTPSVRAVYITKEGKQQYESLGWMNGHDVIYTLPKGVKLIAVKYRETGYNADFVGTFNCNDDTLNQLWEKSRRTLYVTMRDNYMDCPDRERAQWWGDMVNELGEAFYVFDAGKGPLLARKGIYELARWQRDDKTIYSPVPSGRPDKSAHRDQGTGIWDQELPRQMLASIGYYGFWTYYQYTGDKQTLADVYPHVRDYMVLWKLTNDGLVAHRTGEWDWTDWGDNKDVTVLENAWFYLALKGAKNMATLLGYRVDVEIYKIKMEKIEENFNARLWTGTEYRSPDYKGQTDDRANALAVVAGLADPEYYPAIKKVLATQFHASPYMEKYVLESLYLMDAPDQAIERMKSRYKEQLQSPYSTLWEMWSTAQGTYNHAWSGGPLTILSQYAAGIYPSKPGFSEITIAPQPGPLKCIQTTVPTKHSNLEFELIRNTEAMTITVNAPDNSKLILAIPKFKVPIKQIIANGQPLWINGKPTAATTARYLHQDQRAITFELSAAKTTIEIK